MSYNKVNQETERKICDLYVNTNLDSKQIGKMFSLHPTTVAKYVKNNNIKNKYISKFSKWLSAETKINIIKMYNEGIKKQIIMKENNATTSQLDNVLKNIPKRNKNEWRTYLLNENAFDVLNDEAAYWIGFLGADGCICESNHTINIALKEGDKEHLEKFKRFVGCNKPLQTGEVKLKGEIYKAAKITLYSRKMIDILASYGVVPRKSLIFKVDPGLQNNKFFWKGMIDGDGCISETSSTGYYVPSISIKGTENVIINFMKFVNDNIVKHDKKKFCKYEHHCGVGFSCIKAIKIMDYLYSEKHSFDLERKYQKYMTIKEKIGNNYILGIRKKEKKI